MSSFTFRPAVRQQLPLIIGIAGGTGSGKTMSALRIATGLSGGKRFALIDTEAGRALHYADQFAFDHGDLQPPFSPQHYLAAIEAADKAEYPVIVVDSMSHEYAGEGGILDWQEEEFAKSGYKDSMRMASWIKPKMAHKAFVSRLLQVRAHLILCFRAESKIEIVREDGKMAVVEKQGAGGFKGWLPITEKNFPYELTASILLMAEEPGMPQPIKMPEQLREFFPAGEPISERAGEQLAAWASGGTAKAPERQPAPRKPAEAPEPEPTPTHFDLGRWKSLYEPQGLTIADFRAELGIREGAGRAQVQTAADGWLLTHPNVDPELALVTRVLELRVTGPAMALEVRSE